MNVFVYIPPNGEKLLLEDIQHVYPTDKAFFEENSYIVSMEPTVDNLGETTYIIYGRPDNVEEEEELIVFSYGRSCEDTLHELASLCRKEFGGV